MKYCIGLAQWDMYNTETAAQQAATHLSLPPDFLPLSFSFSLFFAL
jgi:hypothetical protein